MATPPPSQVRQSYHPECTAAINNQVHLELYASYVYTSMACYFDKMSSKHLVEFFLQQSSKEKEHAERLIQLQNQRGGGGTFARNISRPDRNCWGNSLKALECALHLSMTVNQSLIDLHKLATEKKDAHLCDNLESHYLQGQENFIKELGGYITNLRKMGAPESGLAEYLFGKLTLGNSKN